MKLGNKRADVIRAFDLLGRLFAQLHRPVVAYAQGIEPTVVQLEEVVQKVFAQVGTLDSAIGTAREFGDKVSALLRNGNGAEIDQSASTVTGVTLCVPLPGKVC
jgi:phospholipid/cholesterol/gamma-HCH transport system substrate-binding protein